MDMKDLSREERIKKVEYCAEQIKSIYKNDALRKATTRPDNEVWLKF